MNLARQSWPCCRTRDAASIQPWTKLLQLLKKKARKRPGKSAQEGRSGFALTSPATGRSGAAASFGGGDAQNSLQARCYRFRM